MSNFNASNEQRFDNLGERNESIHGHGADTEANQDRRANNPVEGAVQNLFQHPAVSKTTAQADSSNQYDDNSRAYGTHGTTHAVGDHNRRTGDGPVGENNQGEHASISKIPALIDPSKHDDGSRAYGTSAEYPHGTTQGEEQHRRTAALPSIPGTKTHSEHTPRDAGHNHLASDDASHGVGLGHASNAANNQSHGGAGQKLAGKIEAAIGSAIGSQSLKAKGLEKQHDAEAAKAQGARRTDGDNIERNEHRVGAHPENTVLGVPMGEGPAAFTHGSPL